jgi:hypothetical protein
MIYEGNPAGFSWRGGGREKYLIDKFYPEFT